MPSRFLGVEYADADPSGTPPDGSVLVFNLTNGKLWSPNNGAWSNIVGGANGVTSNSGPSVLDANGNPTSTTPIPSTATVVSSLPVSGDFIGQYVIYQGKPYIWTLGIGGGPDFWFLDTTESPTIYDTWANLSLYDPNDEDLGTVFNATDRTVSYCVQTPGGTKTWLYFNGIFETTISGIPTDLGPTDVNFLFRASDYFHNWKWTGSAFSLAEAAKIGFAGGLAPGTVMYNVGSPPFGGTGSNWHACDGATVDVSQEDGSLVSTTLPTITTGWYVR